jgi:Fur family peroxide stress response transcriptional regulator
LDTRHGSTDEKLERFRVTCRERGLKITPQRIAIYRELSHSNQHPNASRVYEEVRKIFPNISLDTVSRTLQTFSELDIASMVEFSGEAKRFDPNLDPHHHFRCIQCGHIIDFCNDDYDAIEVPAELQTKYTILGKRVCLEGICDRCKTGD